MSEKIEIMGISVEKCYAEDIMESINQHWNEDTLATYGVITMKLLIAAQKGAVSGCCHSGERQSDRYGGRPDRPGDKRN